MFFLGSVSRKSWRASRLAERTDVGQPFGVIGIYGDCGMLGPWTLDGLNDEKITEQIELLHEVATEIRASPELQELMREARLIHAKNKTESIKRQLEKKLG